MTEQELINAIIEFNNDADVQRLQNLYNSPTFPDILAVGRRELSHSSFLAWLFNMSANHGLGTLPILQLLELFVGCSRRQNKKLDNALMNAILSRVITINNTHIKTEYNIQNQKMNRGRADIVIDSIVDLGISDTAISKLRIVIENKVYSNEHDKQTCTYFDYYEKEKQDGEQILYIYLTPLLYGKQASCNEFVHITYQDLLDNVFEPILLLQNLSERTRFILTEYINCLSIPVEEFHDNKKSIKRTTIMAISKNERNLLESFWIKHQNLIMAVLTEITTDPDSDEDRQKKAKELLNKLNKKDYSKYSVNGEGAYGKSLLVTKVVECYLEKNPTVTIDELKHIFPDNIQGAGLGVVRSAKDTINDYSRYRESIHPQTHETFHICTQWRKGGNIEKFISHVEKNIPYIKIAQL